MKHMKTLAIAAAALAVTTGMAFAQGGGGGRGLITGKISAIDTTALTVTVTTADGDQTFTVTRDTTVTTAVASKASDLKVGDRIQVAGVPSEITAVSITIPSATTAAPAAQGGGQPGGGGGQGGFGGRGGQGGGQGGFGGGNGQSRVAGKVTSVSPLKISTDAGEAVSVKTAADTKVNKLVEGNANSLKVGQTITTFGQPGDDGSITAMRVFVGDMSSMGMGMGGGRGGFGGRGQGGQGGRGGRRGGQGGGGGAAPQIN